jgi:hypothetical protein
MKPSSTNKPYPPTLHATVSVPCLIIAGGGDVEGIGEGGKSGKGDVEGTMEGMSVFFPPY